MRKFYVDESVKCNWSVRQLERQINSFYYERLLSTQKEHKEEVRSEINTLEEGLNPGDVLKDPYVLEFLNLKDHVKFSELNPVFPPVINVWGNSMAYDAVNRIHGQPKK